MHGHIIPEQYHVVMVFVWLEENYKISPASGTVDTTKKVSVKGALDSRGSCDGVQ